MSCVDRASLARILKSSFRVLKGFEFLLRGVERVSLSRILHFRFGSGKGVTLRFGCGKGVPLADSPFSARVWKGFFFWRL